MKSNSFKPDVQTCSYQRFWAFTLAEMMVVLLILSIVLAAMAPIMTTRMKRDSDMSGSRSVWKWAANKMDAYFGPDANQTAMIGQTEVVAADPSARLIINTSETRPNHILFKNDAINGGVLKLIENGLLLGSGSLYGKGIAVGNVEADGDESIVIGNDILAGANSEKTLTRPNGSTFNVPDSVRVISLGNEITSYGNQSISIGNVITSGVLDGWPEQYYGDYSVALGNNITSTAASSSISVGQNIINASSNSIVIGNNSYVRGTNCGVLHCAPARNSIVLGNNASNVGTKYGIVIGDGASIVRPEEIKINSADTGEGAIAIGRSATIHTLASLSSSGNYASPISQGAIAIGRQAEANEYSTYESDKSRKYNASIAIGAEAKAQGASIAIGSRIFEESVGYLKFDTATEATGLSIAIGMGAVAGPDYISECKTTDLQCTGWKDNSGIAIGTLAKAQTPYSIAIGTEASTSDSSSIAIGYQAQTNGVNSVSIGRESRAASSSTAINGSATGDGSIAIGSFATGDHSIAIRGSASGVSATGLHGQATGDYSTAIGFGARATADYSTAIGQGAKATAQYSTAIGFNAVSSNANTITLGYFNSFNDLTTVYIPGNLVVGGHTFLGLSNYSDTYVHRAGHTDEYYLCNLTTNGGDYLCNWTVGFGSIYRSDRRLKYVGKEFTSGLDKIRQLKAFNYTFKKDEKKTPHVGVIAQDLQKIFPNAVEKGGDGFLTIRMEDMFYALVNAVKELDAKITAMVSDFAKQKEQLFSAQKDINALKKENKELKAQNKKLEARLNALEAKIK